MSIFTEGFIIVSLIALWAVGIAKAVAWVQNKRSELINSFPQDPIQEIYDSLNHAIKTSQPTLRLGVDHISAETFVAFYKGVRKFYPELSMELRCYPNTRNEFIEFNLTKYAGPKNRKLEVKMFYEETPVKLPENVFPLVGATAPQVMENMFSPVAWKANPKVKPHKQEPAQVVDLLAYRKSRGK